MTDRKEKILYETFHVESEDCRTRRDDIKMALAINPDIDRIYLAMDENGKQMCLELLDYMAKNNITLSIHSTPNAAVFKHKGLLLNKDQLFENFL